MPRCYECLSEDVAVEILDACFPGCEHWLCKPCWDAGERLRAKFTAGLQALVGTALQLLVGTDG